MTRTDPSILLQYSSKASNSASEFPTAMGGRKVLKAARAAGVHTLLLAFTIALVLKLHTFSSCSWWFVFSPLWLFHAVVSHGRFSIPAPSLVDAIPWDPFHSLVSMPLLVAFELLLCIYLESCSVNEVAALNLKVVFAPAFLLETIIIIDNTRMSRLLLRGEEFTTVPEPIDSDVDILFQLQTHFLSMLAMVFILMATVFLVDKFTNVLAGFAGDISYWGIYIAFSFGQLFAYAVIIQDHQFKCIVVELSSRAAGSFNREDPKLGRVFIGGHFVIVLILGFEILLCMYLEGTPARAREIPIPIVFSPLFLLQGVGVLFSTSRLVETILVLLHSEANNAQYFYLATPHVFLECIFHGSRFLGWWSIDDQIREADAKGLDERKSGCSTFDSLPDEVKKMAKKDLIEEACTLLAKINEEIQLTRSNQKEYEKLRDEKILCRICFQRSISVVLFPCRHRILCRTCGEQCSKCPICRISIVKRVLLHYVSLP